jgi:hypothetical protein
VNALVAAEAESDIAVAKAAKDAKTEPRKLPLLRRLQFD